MAAVVGIVASLLGPAIEIGKCFQKQLSYLCCFQTNVKALADAAKDLEDAQADLQVRVDEAKRNGELISNQVETWLAKANDTHQVIALGIGTTQKPRIYNLKSRYSLGRKAKKTADSMKELRDTCKFDHVSSRARPASMGQLTPSLRPTPGIESRNKIEEDIITAMRDEDVYVIGVCGMGGVGKTTMAKQIMKRAKEREGIFDEVLLVAVGQQADMLKIQHGIADWLGLKFEEETLAPRAIRLWDRLQGGKRKLIIIDDVWERIHLEDLGVPCESRLCTILLTSRDRGVLHQMNAQSVFTVQILSDEEAWSMFKENVGACVDDSNLLTIVSEVAKECKGLPLALVVVSRALRGQVSKGIWSDALKQLKSSNSMDIEDIIKDVYNPIRLSYDFLGSPHAKSLLFLCSSFPEDHEISLEYLAFYGLGLCIFEDMNNLEEARNRLAGLVDTLKKRFLILDGKDERYVKMHDVVRDVAIFIASKDKKAIREFTSLDWSRQNTDNDCNMLSVSPKQHQFDFPMGFTFPMLSFLWMNMLGFELPSMSDNFFKGMQQLKVVSISCVSFGLSPQNMRLLKNLRTLHLYGCNLKTLSPVGELSSLEILCCHSCDVIKELPAEIGRLERLRLLEFTNCPSLKIIVPGVISRLGQLEELKMLDGFKGWESQEIENERRNASLAELLSLSKLTCLEIEIEDWSLHSQVLPLSSNIVKYNIQVGEKSKWAPWWEPSSTTYDKKLYINLRIGTSLVNWIYMFASTAEYLCFEGADSNGFNFSRNQNMRCLIFKNCQTVVKLASSASTDRGFDVFPVLEDLYLSSLPKLEEIFDGPIPDGSNSFVKLKKIRLSTLDRLMHVWKSKSQDVLLSNLCTLHILLCGKLRRVFSSSVVIRSLSQLETIEIKYCESMEEVFLIEFDHGNSRRITFPKLKKLSLANLGCLTNFCKGINIIEFSQLVWLEILHCPKLTSFSNAADQNHVNSSVDDSVHIFCNTKITFGSLKRLNIGGYNNISYLWCHHIPNIFFGQLEELSVYHICDIDNLFSYSVAANLVNLKNLTIVGCDEMAHVIADDSIAQKPKIKFHKLERLELLHLRSLEAYCKGIHGISIEFHRPIELIIKDCPKLTGVINIIHSYQNDHLNSSSTHHPSLHLICYTKSTFGSLHPFFGNLEVLKIDKCFNITNLFSYSVAANLVNLKNLTIKGCKEMLYAIADDDAETSETKLLVIIFRKLKELEIVGLPKLQSVCEGRLDLQLPSLQQLDILDCQVMENFTTGLLSTPNLEYFKADSFIHLSCNTQITFENLKELSIEDYESTSGCAHNYLFSHSMAGNFVNLETLSIYRCSEMVYVIADDDDEVAKTSHEKNPQTIFHKLKRVVLHDLPKLQSLCDWGWDVQFPLLERLFIYECPGMEDVTPESIRKQNMDAVQNRLARERSITFENLKELSIEDYESTSGCAHNYLFSHSMAGNFVNLETLSIYRCSEMVYVIADDDDEVAKTSHERQPQTIFHKLKWVDLNHLPKLQSFCDWRWDVRFPSLEALMIRNCPGMEDVTPESIRKQNMDAVQNRLARERSGRLS